MAASAMPSHPPTIAHNLLLAAVSIVFLPASLLALCYNYAALVLCPQNGLRHHVQRSTRFRPRKVLITGVSTPAGLRIARALHHTGHDVVGVEIGGYPLLNYVRWSKAITKLYCVAASVDYMGDHHYAERLFQLIVKERAAIWIDCSSGVPAQAQVYAKGLVEERSSCICIVPNAEHISQLGTRQGFQKVAQKIGLPSLEIHSIRSRSDIYNILNGSGDKKYLLSSPNGTSEPAMHTILPRRTVSQTYHDVAQLKLTKGTPWTLEQYMEGFSHFAACAIVVQGKIEALAASSSQLNEMGYLKAVSGKSGLSEAIRQHMESFVEAVDTEMTSHLTMDFYLDEKATHAGVVQQILPFGARLTPHESLLLFEGRKGSIDLTKAYLAALSTTTTELDMYTGLPYTDTTSGILVPTDPEIGVYSFSEDLKRLVVGPTWQLLCLRSNISNTVRSWITFLQHLVAWQEVLYDFGDPLPFFWYTHISIPYHLISDAVQEAWSRRGIRSKSDIRKRINRSQAPNGN